MKIYTKTGDTGETSLFGGSRVSKGDLRVWCYGSMDEANAAIGLAAAQMPYEHIKDVLRQVQERLFCLCTELASDELGNTKLKDKINDADVTYLEQVIDKCTAEYGQITRFVIPGETVLSAHLHVARTAVRRAERYISTLAGQEPVPGHLISYVNRLSDLLFSLSQAVIAEELAQSIISKLKPDNFISEWENDMDCVEKLWEKMENAVAEESQKLGINVSFAVADRDGNLLFFKRSPKAKLASINAAINKAYTAVAMDMDTDKLAAVSQPNQPLFGINTADPRHVIFGGGMLLVKDGKTFGALAVAGGTPDEDVIIAKHAVEIFKNN